MSSPVVHRILLVEDERDLRKLMAQLLVFHDPSVVVAEAEDGPSAIDVFEREGPFDLAVIDINLPVISGVEVCHRLLAQHPKLAVVICTAGVTSKHEDELLGLGVDRFLPKPFYPEQFLEMIEDSLATCPT